MQLENATSGRFRSVSWTATTESTNADMVVHARRSPNEAAVLFTDVQTAGRGRRNRRWDMESGGGLLVSFFVPWSGASEAHVIPTALGVAAVKAIEASDRSVGLKWPNDLLAISADPELSGKKVGGMLSEVVTIDGQLAGVVVGLGCNTSWPSNDPNIRAEHHELADATSLDALTKTAVDREKLARDLISAFDAELESVMRLGPTSLFDRYRDRCLTIGTHVRIERPDGVITGIATDVDRTGALIVVHEGVQLRVDVGDVVHLRSGIDEDE